MARSGSDLTLRSTLARTALIREAIVKASDLNDLEQRVKAIPGAPPLPREAASLPFPALKSTLLGQIDALATSVRDQHYGGARRRQLIERDVWLGGLRSALTNLLLAFGFASASSSTGQAPALIQLMLRLPRAIRGLPGTIRRKPARKRRKSKASSTSHGGDAGGSKAPAGHGRRRHRGHRSEAGGMPGRSEEPALIPTPPSGPETEATDRSSPRGSEAFRDRWQRWKRRLRE